MPFTPFPIRCTTCQAKLAVRDPELIGQVIACPKCGSMVLIERPLETEIKPLPPKAQPKPVPSEPPENVTENAPELPPKEPFTPPETEPLIRRRGNNREISSRFLILVSLFSVVVLLLLTYVAVLYRAAPEEEGPDTEIAANDPIPPVIVPDPIIEEPDESATEMPDDHDEMITEIVQVDTPPEPAPVEPEIPEPDPISDPIPDVTPPPELPELPQRVDVMERMKLPLAGFHLDRVTFFDAMRTVSDLSGVPISMNVTQMRKHGISVKQSVRMNLENAAVIDVVAELTSQAKMAFELRKNVIHLYPISVTDTTLHERRYDISDLITPTETSAAALSVTELKQGITELVSPSSWERHGGPARIHSEGTVLVVTQDMPGQRETMRLLEKIRYAKKLPLKTEIREPVLQSEELCWKALSRPLTFHIYQTRPLSEILDSLEKHMGIKTVVDHEALEQYRLFFADLTGKVNVENGNINDVYENLLASVDQLDLTFRIVDSDLIEITTMDAALLPENFSMESHYIGDRVKLHVEPLSPEQLVEMLKSTIDPQSWGQWSSGGGAILLDRSSQTLFIRQSQPVQRMIRAWLKSDLPEDASLAAID